MPTCDVCGGFFQPLGYASHRASHTRKAKTVATPKPRPRWRDHYEVWLQAEGRDRNEREYAARCLTCSESHIMLGKAPPWLVSMAGSRTEAWEFCKQHELKEHAQ